MTTAVTPTKIYRTFFPAGANVPNLTTRLRGKVFATDAGLYVFTTRLNMDEARPDFHSPINFDETPEPPDDYAAAQSGWVVTTDAGKVLIRTLGGCPCSFRKLKSWTPTWAVREAAWRG